MSCKLLIDECLSPALVGLAVAAGHVESSCVRDLGWSGTKDWKLVRQRDLFGIALEELAVLTDLVNQALEIFEQEDRAVVVERYEIPQVESDSEGLRVWRL